MFERFTEPAREAVLAEVMRIVISDERSGGRQVPFTPNAEKVLERALSEARAVGHKHIGPEHILLGLLDDPGIAGRILFTPTSRARRLMIAAAGHAVDDRRSEYDVCDLLLAMTGGESTASLLAQLGVDEAAVREAIQRQPPARDPPEASPER